MPNYSALHICLPSYDNLGDRLGMDAMIPLFAEHQLHLTVDLVDIRALVDQKTTLDSQLDRINQTYDLVIIGAGGYLHPLHLLPRIFSQIESWGKLTIPLVLFGFGVVNLHEHNNYPTRFSLLSPYEPNHLTAALKAATAVSVRDVRSWFVARRLLQRDAHKVFLTGCPTVFLAGRLQHQVELTHEIGLNLPFRHAACQHYHDELMYIARTLITTLRFRSDAQNQTKPLKWICHSETERVDAERLRDHFQHDFDIVNPTTFEETSQAFASCRIALVTKGHAGIFCLANRVPFAFLSYDIKCDALVEALWDHPPDLLLYIHQLKELDIDQALQSLLNRVLRLSPDLKFASDNLLDHGSRELEDFFHAIKARMR
ncbi:polysaccharide pyruvyl transferase family protein [Leptolyngbya sp. CCY15150]|uniref:polysaccharide pyruvyl transferase family protein n=1 Tax=Leptolyngbya sp. CCY15150 TaxID=2767772 RepID=UPI00194DD0F4|nr:polysaccharide pyruvyl transferase family protein [Leptolyngbya sp. CCY15150]